MRQTLIRKTENQKTKGYKYFYCLTPACDTIRLRNETRKFLMLELREEEKKTNLIIMEENTRLKTLLVDPKPGNMDYFFFRGCNKTGRVLAERKVPNEYNDMYEEKPSKDMFVFKTEDEKPIELMWLGEVRRNRANRDMADLNRQWLRLGINDSEYLRLAGEGKAPFKTEERAS